MILTYPCKTGLYHQLAYAHYLSRCPAVPAHCIGARCIDAPHLLAGVLVLAHPTLNAPWRTSAWPQLGLALHQPSRPDASTRALAIGRALRTIARVVVEPRFRGRGVATALVRAAMRWAADQPNLIGLEAVASMAILCPIFERAGMRQVSPPRAARASRLHEALARLNLLVDDLRSADRLARLANTDSLALRRALYQYLDGSRATRTSLHRSCAISPRPTKRRASPGIGVGDLGTLAELAWLDLRPKAIFVWTVPRQQHPASQSAA